MVKFNKKLQDYQYICCFDIATHCGCSVYSLEKQNFIYYIEFNAGYGDDNISAFYDLLNNFFQDIQKNFGVTKENSFCLKEKKVLQMMGGKTTIKTIINLTKLQAVYDLFLYLNDFPVYDWEGISVPTCKAYYRKVLGKKDITKQDIQEYVCNYYRISTDGITDNISDSMSFILPFMLKWNKDIDEKIKELKRERKALKAINAIKQKDKEIERLNGLRI